MKTFPKSIIIASFAPWQNNQRSSTNGMIDPMLYYFVPRSSYVYLIEQPYPGSDRISTFLTRYAKGKQAKGSKKASISTLLLYPFLRTENTPGTRLSFKLRDLISTIELGFFSGKKFELFIGLESVNALAGIALRKLGVTKKVVYYVSDYSPKRYKNKYLNSAYLWLDRFCAYHADFIWDVSKAMHPARIQAGLDTDRCAPVVYVPNALFKEQINTASKAKRDKYSAVFVGTLGLENGPDLAIQAFKKVIKKFPEAILHIIGGGEEEKYLKKLTKKLKLDKNITFHGFISDVKKISSMIQHFQVALAPYKYQEDSVRLYGDATKIRQYLAAGLPVITTSVPPLGKEAQKKGAALIVGDNKEELANAIILLFTNSQKRMDITKHAINFAKKNTWENTYGSALLEIGYKSS